MSKPTYPLDGLKALVTKKSWRATLVARDGALALGFDGEDICDCIVNQLAETHFCKTMAAERMPGLMQDVYHITYQGERVYLKLQVVNDEAIVISFKQDERVGS